MSFFVPQKARKIKVFQSYTSFVMILSTTFPGLLTIRFFHIFEAFPKTFPKIQANKSAVAIDISLRSFSLVFSLCLLKCE